MVADATRLLLPPTVLTRLDALLALALACCMGVCSYFLWLPEICGVVHDDALYVLTAKAMADGDGYRLIHLPGSPRQTKYPPLLPAVLALLWKVSPEFPANARLLLAVPWLCGMGTVAVSYLYLVRFGYASRRVAALACLCCTTAPTFALQAAMILTEFPFALLWLAASWRLEITFATEAEEKPRFSWWSALLLGMLCGLPTLCRAIGIALVPTVLWLGWRRQRRALPWLLLGLAFTIGPWILWVKGAWGAWENDEVMGYYTDYLGWWQGSFFHQLRVVLVQNFQDLTLAFAGSSQKGLFMFGVRTVPAAPLVFFLQGILAWVVLAIWGYRGRIMVLGLVPYLVLVWFWPWQPERFLLPLLPLSTAALLMGYRAVLSNSSTGAKSLTGIAALVVLAANLWLWAEHVTWTQSPDLTGFSRGNWTARWQVQRELQEWVRRQTQPEDVIAAELDPAIFLYSGRRSFRPFSPKPMVLFYGAEESPIGTQQEFLRLLRRFRPKYLVTSARPYYPESEAVHRMAAGICREHPDWLQEVARLPSDPEGVIYRVHPERLPPEE